ncbi:protein naked cuticle homolog 1 isoform X2 [Phyllostomus discolor]|uniref:Protein naked cuticle homolog n=1 Tax=Phyllostomus discolor TaxID=89673 RepID=A0A7E6CQZ9_9CHIR|nr:protein naked cuticle homolog 1 isoform X2 [Phyllostomus discolor]
MGKLHSKPAAVCKRRESPEGDSFAVSAAWARKGIEEWIGRQRCPGGSSGPRQLRAAGTAGRGARMSSELWNSARAFRRSAWNSSKPRIKG